MQDKKNNDSFHTPTLNIIVFAYKLTVFAHKKRLA